MGFFTSITNSLFGKGGAGTMGEAVARAKELAPGARFNPYTVRTTSGTTSYDPETGTYRTELDTPFQQYLTQATGGATNLINQVGAFDPAQRTQDIINQRAALLQPLFAQQATQLQGTLFGSGTLGKRLAGEALGAGAGTGLLNQGLYEANLAQSRALAELAPQASQQAYAEMAQLGQLGTGLMSSAMGVTDIETQLMQLGLSSEVGRSAAALGAANMELAPYTAKANVEQQQRGQNADFVGGLISAFAPKPKVA